MDTDLTPALGCRPSCTPSTTPCTRWWAASAPAPATSPCPSHTSSRSAQTTPSGSAPRTTRSSSSRWAQSPVPLSSASPVCPGKLRAGADRLCCGPLVPGRHGAAAGRGGARPRHLPHQPRGGGRLHAPDHRRARPLRHGAAHRGQLCQVGHVTWQHVTIRDVTWRCHTADISWCDAQQLSRGQAAASLLRRGDNY